MSATIVTTLYGDKYDKHLSDWQKALSRLDPKAEQVILVTDRKREGVEPYILQLVVDLPEKERVPSGYFTHALQHVKTDWTVFLDIDDRPLPKFLANLADPMEYGVHCFTLEEDSGKIWTGSPENWKTTDRIHGKNALIGISAVKTSLWRMFPPKISLVYDYLMWITLKASQVNVFFDPTVRCIYGFRGESITENLTNSEKDNIEDEILGHKLNYINGYPKVIHALTPDAAKSDWGEDYEVVDSYDFDPDTRWGIIYDMGGYITGASAHLYPNYNSLTGWELLGTSRTNPDGILVFPRNPLVGQFLIDGGEKVRRL